MNENSILLINLIFSFLLGLVTFLVVSINREKEFNSKELIPVWILAVPLLMLGMWRFDNADFPLNITIFAETLLLVGIPMFLGAALGFNMKSKFLEKSRKKRKNIETWCDNDFQYPSNIYKGNKND